MFKLLLIKRYSSMDWIDFILFGFKFRLVARPLVLWKYFAWSNWSPSHRLFFQCPWFTLFIK
jgi:hypothetical protein